MQQISGVKTIEDALAAIDAIPLPQTLALPAALKDDATSTQKAAYETTVKEITRRNDFAARESALISAVKELAKARVNAVPEGVKVIGLELRADTGDLEMISLRIVTHK